MTTLRSNAILRYALLGDALASGAMGCIAFLGADLVAEPLGLPVALLRYAGLILLPYAVLVSWLGMRREPARGAVLAVIVINALWMLDSIALLASGWVAPTALGTAFVLLQALIVAGFAAVQAYGLRERTVRRMAHA